MVIMKDNLESRVSIQKESLVFKSEGERKIADFLSRYSINYRYESGVIVHPNQSQPRIWYPDFYLPDLGIYIEYYGVNGNGYYTQSMKAKEIVYQKENLPVIPIYSWMMQKNWQGYLLNEVRRITTKRYQLGRDIYSKLPNVSSRGGGMYSIRRKYG